MTFIVSQLNIPRCIYFNLLTLFLKPSCTQSIVVFKYTVTVRLIDHYWFTCSLVKDADPDLLGLLLDKPARLTIRVLWSLFLIVRRVPRPSESGCKKCNGLKKYLLGHTFSWKRLSAILCPWNPPWWWFFSLKLNKKCLKTPSKIKGLSFISSNLGNMDFFLIFNCISH